MSKPGDEVGQYPHDPKSDDNLGESDDGDDGNVVRNVPEDAGDDDRDERCQLSLRGRDSSKDDERLVTRMGSKARGEGRSVSRICALHTDD